MIGSIVQFNLDIDYFVACQDTCLHCATDTSIDCRDVFLRDCTADNLVGELIALAGFVRGYTDLNVTVLTGTTGLLLVLVVHISVALDGFLIGYLRSADVCFNLELTQQTVYDDIQVQLAHAGDDGLTGFLVCPGTEGRVFFCQLCQRNTHLVLTSLGLRLDCQLDNRFREFHGFQDYRSLFVAQCVTGGGVLQTNNGCDIACVYSFDILSVVGVHLYDTSHTLLVVLGSVQNGCACVYSTGIYTEEAQLTNKRVSCDLECQCCERLAVGRVAKNFFAGFRISTLDRRYIQRRRHIIYDSVQQFLYALVTIGSTAGNRNHLVCDGGLTDASLDLVDGDFFIVKELLHQSVVLLSNVFHQFLVIFLSLFLQVIRNFFHTDVLAQVIIVNISLHLNQVDDALEFVLRADRQLNRNSVALQTLVHHVDYVVEVSAHDVHFIDINHTRNLILISLSPYSFCLRFYTALCAQYSNRTVQHTQRTLNFYCEVNVSRGVDDVDSVTCPVCSSCSRCDCDTTFLLLFHPVHSSGTLVGLTDLMVDTGVEQNTLGSGCLTGIDVRHDTDISGFFQGTISSHR